MNSRYILAFCALILSIYSCETSVTKKNNFIFETLMIPCSNESETPNLYLSNSSLHIIWTETFGDSMRLVYSEKNSNIISNPKIIAEGSDWFVNWADFPSIASSLDGKNIIVNWLQKSSFGTYDYDIHYSILSKDSDIWPTSRILHNDGVAAEHGFTSFVNYSEESYYASWLDGRHTKTSNPNNSKTNLPMTLYGGYINKSNGEVIEFEIDNKVCDCCQTSSVVVSDGLLSAYRDRTDNEIRDITVQKIKADTIYQVYESGDEWKINGCPVNGPALDASLENVALVWYTANPEPSVWMSISMDNGENFSSKKRIDAGNPMGRVDVSVDNSVAYFTWLEIIEEQTLIVIRGYDIESNYLFPISEITKTSSSRRSGFPILKTKNKTGYLAYTKILSNENSKIQLIKFDLNKFK